MKKKYVGLFEVFWSIEAKGERRARYCAIHRDDERKRGVRTYKTKKSIKHSCIGGREMAWRNGGKLCALSATSVESGEIGEI